ncbi:MAG: ABC transporter ATP-binding protein [Lachnospiraceae bacterium]|nr:ABC transporter ATP-binding protein [Lachnospiraceae bacterium]
MGKILEVKNLRVSFRTNGGTVKAVRDISFDLYEGETLAIVGESGSGKSVTAKSILGINAANTIHEGGEIIYNGEDLLKYSEEEFNKVRGNEISMIFQDPLSSLDPIMTIGKQMTEATLLNNKARQKYAKKDLKFYHANLEKYMRAAGCNDTALTQENVAKALKAANDEKISAKQNVVDELKKNLPTYEKEVLVKSEVKAANKHLVKLVEESIDRVSLNKNSFAYTFRTSLDVNTDRYFLGLWRNPKEEARVAKETAKYEVKIAKNKIAPKVVPANLVDMDITKENILRCINSLITSYEDELSGKITVDYNEEAKRMLEHLKKLEADRDRVITKAEAKEMAIKIMSDVGIKEAEKRFDQFPHEFSGGMRQRIVIAIAIAANPRILICDEPTTALDVTIQSQILELINDVKAKNNISVLFITHDLGVVANMADKVAVMYAGKIVEYGTAEEIFYEPKHPYTWALLSSMPSLDTKEKLEAIPGTPPNMIYPPVGDAFADRNKYALKIDYEKQPPFFKVSDTHYAATWLLHPDAPKVDVPKVITDRIERMKEMGAKA